MATLAGITVAILIIGSLPYGHALECVSMTEAPQECTEAAATELQNQVAIADHKISSVAAPYKCVFEKVDTVLPHVGTIYIRGCISASVDYCSEKVHEGLPHETLEFQTHHCYECNDNSCNKYERFDAKVFGSRGVGNFVASSFFIINSLIISIFSKLILM